MYPVNLFIWKNVAFLRNTFFFFWEIFLTHVSVILFLAVSVVSGTPFGCWTFWDYHLIFLSFLSNFPVNSVFFCLFLFFALYSGHFFNFILWYIFWKFFSAIMFLILTFLFFITPLELSKAHYLLLSKPRDIGDKDYRDQSGNLLLRFFLMNTLYSLFYIGVFPQKASDP